MPSPPRTRYLPVPNFLRPLLNNLDVAEFPYTNFPRRSRKIHRTCPNIVIYTHSFLLFAEPYHILRRLQFCLTPRLHFPDGNESIKRVYQRTRNITLGPTPPQAPAHARPVTRNQ